MTNKINIRHDLILFSRKTYKNIGIMLYIYAICEQEERVVLVFY